jgi:hypothetical protein
VRATPKPKQILAKLGHSVGTLEHQRSSLIERTEWLARCMAEVGFCNRETELLFSPFEKPGGMLSLYHLSSEAQQSQARPFYDDDETSAVIGVFVGGTRRPMGPVWD